MNILARYSLKYLWLNRKRTGVTVLGVIISSALICGVILLGASMRKMMIDNAISSNGNYHAKFSNVPYEKVKYIAQHTEVKASMLTGPTELSVVQGKQNPAKPYFYLTAYDQQAMSNMPVNLTAGGLPQNPGEILVSSLMVAETGGNITIGDQIQVSFGKRTDSNGEELNPFTSTEEGEIFTPSQTVSYTIVGIIQPTFDELISGFPGYAGITLLDPDTLAPGDLVNVGILLSNPYKVYKTVPTIAGNAGLSVLSPESSEPGSVVLYYNDDLLQWSGIKSNAEFTVFFVGVLGFLITLVVVGSGLVIYNAFAISINERKKQFGMFASTGATASQIHQAVMFEALMIGLIGIPPGILGGIVGVGITLSYAQDIISEITRVEQGMQLVVSPMIILATILFSAGMIVVSAWIPANRAARVSPIDAIRLSGEISFSAGAHLKISSLVRRIFGFEVILALKSIWRDRKRYRTTVFSLTISIVLFVVFNSMMEYSSVTARMNNQATNYDLVVYLSGPEGDLSRFIEKAVSLPQVQAYSLKRCIYSQAQVAEDQLTRQAREALKESSMIYLEAGQATIPVDICAYGLSEHERYRQSLGFSRQEEAVNNRLEAILVNRNNVHMGKLYEFDLLNTTAGDSVEVELGEGADSELSGSISFVIAAVADTVPMGGTMPSGQIRLVVSDEVFDRLIGQASSDSPPMDSLYFTTDDLVALVQDVKVAYSTTVGLSLAYHSPYETNQRDQMMETLVKLFFYGFLTLITLVGITNMINIVDTNLQLRRREFAMLKSVGLTPRGFQRILRFESLVYSCAALIVGLPIAVVLSVILYKIFAHVSSFQFTLPWRPMLISAAAVLLIVYTTMTVSGSRVGKDNIVESIKEDNY